MTKEQSPGVESESINLPLLAATSAALLTLAPVVAHQLGILTHLPDPSSRVFASDHITESSAAHPFGIPDGLLGVGSYSLTFTLALLAPNRPIAKKLLAAKLIADGSMATVNVVRQITSFGKLCSWCTATALCTGAMLFAGRKVIKDLR
jgi:uncharacterized membrane protein